MHHYLLSSLPAMRLLAAVLALSCTPLHAAVVILVNQTGNPVKYTILHPGGKEQAAALAAGEQAVAPSEEQIGITFTADKTERRYKLSANSIYFFTTKNKTLDLQLFEMPMPPGEENLPPPKPRIIARSQVKVPVKILADSAQPAVQKIWEKEFRSRIADASKLLEEHCGAVLEVVAVEMWQSDNSNTDFNKALQEFEMKVNPAPAMLAIGFTSQYERPDGQTHLGGTRGPLYPYILAREWSQHFSKNERLEVVTHELGHYFGAVHSGSAESLMRPSLGDRLSNLASFRVQFDPLNTLAMNIFTDELRAAPFHGLHRLPLDARRQLLRIYYTIAKQLPKDPAAPRYMAMLNVPSARPHAPSAPKTSVVDATKTVVQAIVEAAKMNEMMVRVYEGDDLAEFYVNRAAQAAEKLPRDVAADAFLLGLGIGLNDAMWIRNMPVFGEFCRQVESTEDFSDRTKVLGNPTLRKRHDLLLHFMISAALTAHFGVEAAEKAGLAKELADAEGQSGFSFIDLSADLSGIAFAEAVRAKKISFEKLADAFPTVKYVPEIDDLKEGFPLKDFEKNYGSLQDGRFMKEYQKLKDRVKSLPGLQTPPPEKKR